MSIMNSKCFKKLKIQKKNDRRKGFTIIELIVSIAIVGVILIILFSLNLFGIRSFAVQDNQSDLQNDLRAAADHITREVRLANFVEILTSNPTVFSDVAEYSYIYTQTTGGVTSIILHNSSGTRTLTSYSSMNITFSTVVPDKVLYFSIQGTLKDQDTTIDTKVLPLNFELDTTITPSAGSGIALRFRKVQPIETAAIAITTPLPNEYSGQAYLQVFAASGGISPYTYSLNSGTLPPGLILDSNGIFSGTATTPGIYEFNILVQDSSPIAETGNRTYSLIIGNPAFTAASVLAEILIDAGAYPIPTPLEGEASLNLPGNLPYGFMVVIEAVYSDPVVLGIDGTIYPPEGEDPVTAELTLKVINLIDPGDTAVSATPLEIDIPPGEANAAPVASDVAISGQTTVGMTLTGSYTYSDAEGDAPNAPLYKWYCSGTTNPDDKIEIFGESSSTYTLNAGDLNRYIFFEVTPIALTGTPIGNAVLSPVSSLVSSNQAPTATNLSITGTVEVGEQLTGGYLYSDAESDSQGISLFNWYKSSTKTGTKILIHSGSTTYTLLSSDKGFYIFFEVTPVAVSGTSPGLTVMSSNVGKVK